MLRKTGLEVNRMLHYLRWQMPSPCPSQPPSLSPDCSTKPVSGLSIFRQQEAGSGPDWTVHRRMSHALLSAMALLRSSGAGERTPRAGCWSEHVPSQANAEPGQTSTSIQGSLWGTGRGPSSPGAPPVRASSWAMSGPDRGSGCLGPVLLKHLC